MKFLNIGIALACLFMILLIGRFYYNYRANYQPESPQFANGNFPKTMPDGFYRGDTTLSKGDWRGKTFDAASASGINVFASGDRYKFHMYPGYSLTNSHQQVLKIDYNQGGNPIWLRFVVDEVVQLGPNQLVGKIQVKTLPYLPITVGYFTLQQ